ncbi:MAG: hypothetical protein D3910_08870 [Candidatus Electrothrix sp. ATG2]|nr:hypothetical protein [Candidatus Electrothrix sp. ATG2]
MEQGIGADTLSRYFKLLRLDTHIGVSPTAIRTKLSQLQGSIIKFQNEIEQNYKDTFKEVIGAADETFFGNALILVFMDLSSGYLILEDIVDDRSFDTWFEILKPRLEQLGIGNGSPLRGNLVKEKTATDSTTSEQNFSEPLKHRSAVSSWS